MRGPILCLIQQRVTGHSQIMAGPGYLIIPGDGPHSTTVDGIMIIIMAGYGSRIMNGVLPG